MNRRSFLKAAVATAAFGPKILAQAAVKPSIIKTKRDGEKIYAYIKMRHDAAVHASVTDLHNQIMGVAAEDILQGLYGWIQVGGPALVKAKV